MIRRKSHRCLQQYLYVKKNEKKKLFERQLCILQALYKNRFFYCWKVNLLQLFLGLWMNAACVTVAYCCASLQTQELHGFMKVKNFPFPLRRVCLALQTGAVITVRVLSGQARDVWGTDSGWGASTSLQVHLRQAVQDPQDRRGKISGK